MDERRETTRILSELRDGDPSAADRLMTVVYDRLRNLAGAAFRDQRADHTLQPTALVHEVFLRLVEPGRVEWNDRMHFFAVAARAMRMVLADHARRRGAAKRGGDRARVALEDFSAEGEPPLLDLVDLDAALERLNELEPRHVRIVELRFLSGLTVEEVATVLELSRTTVESDWRMARAWLARQLENPGDAG